MRVRTVSLLLLIGIAALILVGASGAQPAGKGTKAAGPPPSETTDLIRLLQTPIEMKDFTTPMTLKEAVQLLYEKFAARGTDLAILINVETFTLVGVSNPMEVQVSLPALPRQRTLHSVLTQITSQAQATYLLRQG